MAPFGAFVDLGEGVEGLLPTNQIANQSGVVEGVAVRVRVLNVEPDRQRIGLALQGVLSGSASDEEAASPDLPPADDQDEDEYAGQSPDGPAAEGEA